MNSKEIIDYLTRMNTPYSGLEFNQDNDEVIISQTKRNNSINLGTITNECPTRDIDVHGGAELYIVPTTTTSGDLLVMRLIHFRLQDNINGRVALVENYKD